MMTLGSKSLVLRQRSNLVAYAFERVNIFKDIKWEMLAENDQIDRRFMFMKTMTPGDCLPLSRGYIHVHNG